MSQLPVSEEPAPPRSSVRRWLPLAVIVLVSILVIAMGWHRQISIETFVRHHAALHRFIETNALAALVAYVAIYVAVVALSIPGALALTVTGGILFGGIVGGSAAMLGATVGATIIFLIARSAFGEFLARRAGPRAARLVDEFRRDAFHYLLFVRLVPLFPFFVVNLVAALAGVRVMTFVVASIVGMLPASFAFAFAGAGLDSVIRAQGAVYNACLAAGRADCRLDFDVRTVVTSEFLAALVSLGVVALIPVIVKRVRARRIAKSSG